MYAPVAQLDRVTGYEPVGRGFESLPAYHKKRAERLFFCGGMDEKRNTACHDRREREAGETVRWTVSLLRRKSHLFLHN